MLTIRNRAARVTALALGCLTAVLLAGSHRAEERLEADWKAQIDRRVRDWQPTAAERRFDEIGWAKDIRDAERLARQHGRPVFLFTHDGRMAVGRC